MRLALVFVTLHTLVSFGFGARILAMIPFPGKSHYIFSSAVVKVLLERGHQVVEYGPFDLKQRVHPNHTYIRVPTRFEDLLKTFTYANLVQVRSTKSIFGLGMFAIWNIGYDFCENVLRDKNIQELLRSDEHFDLVITASTFSQESMLVFGQKFKSPTVNLQGFQYFSILHQEAGNSLNIATVPDSMSFVFTDHMSFKERLLNFISATLTSLFYYNQHLPKHEAIIKKYFHDPNTPSLSAMVTNVSLTLLNTHPGIEYTTTYTPNIVPIGGITIQPDRTGLSEEIKTFLDNGKDGVIYFSFGTIVPAHQLPKEMLAMFINVFKKLPNQVLWKMEVENIPDLPKNIKIVKWVNQMGVLTHPNCAVFITHGGLFSLHEALFAGVPMVGIPFYGDQPFNTRFAEYKGVSVKIDLEHLSEESLYFALKTILDNPEYKERALKLKSIHRDRPLSPADSTGFWIEYVIRHKGAHHLRPMAAYLPWYQLYLVDVIIVFLTAIIALFFAIYLVCKKVLSVFFKRTRNHKEFEKIKKN